MGPGQSRVLIWTVPTVALLLSLFWYKRKSGKSITACQPEGSAQDMSQSETVVTPNEQPTPAVASSPTSPSRALYCRSLSGIDSAPIDIKTNRSPPLVISDQELDLEIEKIKSMRSSTLHAIPTCSSSSSGSGVATSAAGRSSPGSVPHSQHVSDQNARDSANHSPTDAMLGSPTCSIASDGHHSDSDSGKGGSDVATPPPPPQPSQQSQQQPQSTSQPIIQPESLLIVHEFVIPQQLVGRLIGKHGAFVHHIKDKTNAHILIKRHPEQVKGMKVCSIEGTQKEVDRALEMIRDKFPEKRYPEVRLEHVTFADTTNSVSLVADCMHLKLVEGINNDTIVSCMVTPRHLFLQQPTHPTFPSLNVLSAYMNACYEAADGGSPSLPTPVQENTICAARSMGAWYRVMVVSSDEQLANCHVRFLDYGGYATLDIAELRQIRGDFLLLPFQAAECMLAGVQPPTVDEDGSELWPPEAFDAVADLTKGAVVFTQVVDYLEDCTPLVHIYVVRGPHHVVFLNKELANRGLARWEEMTPAS